MKNILAVMVVAMVGGCALDTDQGSIKRYGEATQAIVSTNVSATCTLSGTCMTITTGEMPNGWMKPKPEKSPVSVTWSMPATNCNGWAGGSSSSLDSGTITTIQNPGGGTIGYYWSTDYDVAGLENHWHNSIACNGSSTVVGCPGARMVSYTLSVGGACLTEGGTCAAYGSVWLPPIQDADVIETNCPVDCEASLGACVSACQVTCHYGAGNGDPDCSNCCACKCKAELHANNEACEAPPQSCYRDPADPTDSACLDGSSASLDDRADLGPRIHGPHGF